MAKRERVVAAPPEEVWAVIDDPHHMPRWWPGVTRMEGVERDRFTQVYVSKRGRPVRMDFYRLEADPPWRLAWEQEIPGSPFERVLGESITEIVLEPGSGMASGSGSRSGAGAGAGGTRVRIAARQKLRGSSRTGGFLLRRATGKRLDEALDGLERIFGAA